MEALITNSTPTPPTVTMAAGRASGLRRTRGLSRSRRTPAAYPEVATAVQLGSQAVEFLDIPSMGESAAIGRVTWGVPL